MPCIETDPPELSARELGFIGCIVRKYPRGKSSDKHLYRSLAIFCVMVMATHLVERIIPSSPARLSWWLPLLIIALPAIWLFSRYRRFSIFRSCVLSKMAARLSQYESIAPPSTSRQVPKNRSRSSAASTMIGVN